MELVAYDFIHPELMQLDHVRLTRHLTLRQHQHTQHNNVTQHTTTQPTKDKIEMVVCRVAWSMEDQQGGINRRSKKGEGSHFHARDEICMEYPLLHFRILSIVDWGSSFHQSKSWARSFWYVFILVVIHFDIYSYCFRFVAVGLQGVVCWTNWLDIAVWIFSSNFGWYCQVVLFLCQHHIENRVHCMYLISSLHLSFLKNDTVTKKSKYINLNN